MHEKLLDLISSKLVLSDKDVALCKKYFEPAIFPKNRIIEEEGQIPRYLYFIVNGFVRLFHYNDSGEEITTHINCPPGFITSYSHFIDQTKSPENVECITECELLKISKINMDMLMSQSVLMKDFSITIYQQSIGYNEMRSR